MNKLAIGILIAATFSLSACNTQNAYWSNLSVQVKTTASKAEIAVYTKYCPIVTSGDLDAVAAKGNSSVQTSYAAAKEICANGQPTNAVVAGMDLIALEPVLQMLVSKK